MANPNLTSATAIYGKTAVASVTTTPTAVVENASSSGKLLKVNFLMVANVDGSADADISVDIFRSSTSYSLIKTATVPVDSSLDLFSKVLYLEEGDALRVSASADGDLQVVCSYEELS